MIYLIDLLIILLIFIIIILPKIKQNNNKKACILLAFFLYLSAVYALTLMPFRPFTNLMNSGLVLNFNYYAFSDIINSYGAAEKEAILNVLMMVPFGILLPLVKKNKVNVFLLAAYTFLFSLSIETLQLLDPSRSSDVTDLITNTVGGILGYIILKSIFKIEKKINQ